MQLGELVPQRGNHTGWGIRKDTEQFSSDNLRTQKKQYEKRRKELPEEKMAGARSRGEEGLFMTGIFYEKKLQ